MSEEIDEILQSLHQFHNKLILQLYSSDKETQTSGCSSVLHNLPTPVLHKIFLFLNFSEDFPNLSETCTFFNKILSSRKFQVLSYTLSKSLNPESKVLVPEEESKSDYDFGGINSKSEAIAEMKKFAAVNKFLSNKILNQDKIIEDLDKQTGKLQTDLRIQNNIKNKCIEKISKLEEKLNFLKEEQEKSSGGIERIIMADKLEIENLTQQAALIIQENNRLVFENKVLGSEVKRITHEFQGLNLRCQSFFESILKIKDYFGTMFEPRVQQLISSFETIII